MDRRRLIILTLMAFLCFPIYTFAETIVLKSGKTVEGKIVEKTDKYIKIDFYGVPLTYYFDEIASINDQKLEGSVSPASLPANSSPQPEITVTESAPVVNSNASNQDLDNTMPNNSNSSSGVSVVPPEGQTVKSREISVAQNNNGMSKTCPIQTNGLAILLLVVLVLCGVLIFPIWMIIHCVISSSLEGKSKVLWFLVILFSWPLGAIIYALFACEKKSIPWISAIAILCIGLLSIFPILNMLRYSSQQAVMELAKVDQIDTQELSPEELARFRASLETLKKEVKSSDLKCMLKAANFIDLFTIYARDNKITSEEYEAWIEKFDSRGMLDRKEFSSYVRGLRLK